MLFVGLRTWDLIVKTDTPIISTPTEIYLWGKSLSVPSPYSWFPFCFYPMETWLQGNHLDWWTWRERTVQHGTYCFHFSLSRALANWCSWRLSTVSQESGLFPGSLTPLVFWDGDSLSWQLKSSHWVPPTGYWYSLSASSVGTKKEWDCRHQFSFNTVTIKFIAVFKTHLWKIQLSLSQAKSKWETWRMLEDSDTSWCTYWCSEPQCSLLWLQFSTGNCILRVLNGKLQRMGERTHQLLCCILWWHYFYVIVISVLLHRITSETLSQKCMYSKKQRMWGSVIFKFSDI